MNEFYVAAGFPSAIKKRKPTKKTPPVAKKTKANKEIIVEDDEENENEEDECEINSQAIIELCFYYESLGVSLYECIMLYNDDINSELKDCYKYDFVPLLKNDRALYNLQQVLDEIDKKKLK